MQIAIIGAGVSGLTSYLFLVKNLPNPPAPSPPHEYVVYESHSISDRKKGEGSSEIPLIGSGLGIAPNGMNVLYELDKKLHDEVQARGFPTTQIDFKNGRGWHLGSSQGTYDYADRTEAMLMVSRQDIMESCFEHFPKDLIVHATVSRVIKADKDGKPTIEFADGASRSFDLVIGADGVWSKARSAILEEDYAAYYTYVRKAIHASQYPLNSFSQRPLWCLWVYFNLTACSAPRVD
jgi:2-polyprenyl-6-methoxyphenol hydroxylase-like FAD-dependent oxidoreductase